MAITDNTEKSEQFNEFFSIKHEFNVNIQPLQLTSPISFDDFIQLMPHPFKMASDIITLDQAALKPLQGVSAVAGQLVEYLHHQAKKIDLLVSYILSQEDKEDARYPGLEFGGSGVIFNCSEQLALGQILALKIFLLSENCAVYCHVEVIENESVENDSNKEQTLECNRAKTYQHKVIFNHIRDEDRETLVRTSLHLQSKQLQVLTQQRNKEQQ